MSKLKHCPFCGGTIKHEEWCYIPMILNMNRYTEKQLVKAWNQRAERTCKLERVDRIALIYDLSCGHKAHEDIPNFCPTCGAKVVE